MAQLETMCCITEAQEVCCETHEKAECCGSGVTCGCDTAAQTGAVRDVVRGRYAVAARAVIAEAGMDQATRADMAKWTGCIAGALTREAYERALNDAGLTDIEIRQTHRVHAQAVCAIMRARKPSGP